MAKSTAAVFFLWAGALADSASAWAGTFKSRPLEYAELTLAAEPQLVVQNGNDFTFFGHAGYGLGQGLGVQLKAGGGKSPNNDHLVIFGGSFDLPLLEPDGYPGLIFSLGGSNWQKGSVDGQLQAYKAFYPFILYLGVGSSLLFARAPGPAKQYPTRAIFGIDAQLDSWWSLMLEGGLHIHQSSDYLSAGLRFFWPLLPAPRS